MTTAEIATAFAERGWYVLPCYPQQKIPFFPIAKQGYKSASNKPATVKKWFEETPLLNIGIACAPSNLVVFDGCPVPKAVRSPDVSIANISIALEVLIARS